jgi:hypothetical protein
MINETASVSGSSLSLSILKAYFPGYSTIYRHLVNVFDPDVSWIIRLCVILVGLIAAWNDVYHQVPNVFLFLFTSPLSVKSDDRLFDYLVDFASCPDRWVLAKWPEITTRDDQWSNKEEISTVAKSGYVSFANSDAQRPLRLELGDHAILSHHGRLIWYCVDTYEHWGYGFQRNDNVGNSRLVLRRDDRTEACDCIY